MLINSDKDFKWLQHIKSTLCNIDRNDIWLNQQNLYGNIKCVVKNTLTDQFIQRWQSQLQQSSKGKNYNVFKETISFENYL